MANTYTQIYIHVVCVVKGRQNLIPSDKKDELYKYMTGIFANKGNKVLAINGMPDHVHIFFSISPDISLSSLMKEVKRSVSFYINQNNWFIEKFEWQSGFGAFSYAKSQIDTVCKYIMNQEEHHKVTTFREEYISFLKKFDIDYNEKYIFTEV